MFYLIHILKLNVTKLTYEKTHLNENELINILNGVIINGWEKFYKYVNSALKYRKIILNEFI